MTVLNSVSEKIYSFFKKISTRKLIFTAFGLICAELLTILIVNPVFYRDSAEYIATVEAFSLHVWPIAFPPHLPVFYTALAGLLSELSIPPATALLLISGSFTALTVFPLFGVLKKMMPEKWAAWGCLLFALFPDIIRCGCAPLIDSGRFFFMTMAIYLIFSMPTERICWKKLLSLGVTYGALALVRAEGICFVAFAILTHGLLLFHDLFWKQPYRIRAFTKTFLFLSIPVAAMFLICIPRMYQMQQATGYPCLDIRQTRPIKMIMNSIFATGQTSKEESAGKKQAAPQNAIIEPQQMEPFLDPWQKRYWDNFFSGLNYLYFPFTILGIFLLFRSRKLSFHHILMLLLFVLNSLFHYVLHAGAGRYLLINVIFLMPFTLAGFQAFFTFVRNKSIPGFALACGAAVLLAGIEIFRSLGNLNEGRAREFRQAKEFFCKGGPLSGTTNSGNKYPTVLLLGDDYGLGYYSRVNLVVYSDYPDKLCQEKTIEELLTEGVSNRHIKHWLEKELPEKIYFDAVVVDSKRRNHEIDPVRHYLEHKGQYDRLTFYKVKKERK